MSTPSKPTPSKPTPATPVRAARFKSVTPGSATSARAQCSDNPADFALVKIHTAKCSVCDKRNTTDEMRRCKGCTWQVCRPCQIEREQKGRSLAHGNLMTATPGAASIRRQKLFPVGALAETKDSEAEAALAKINEEEREESKVKKAEKAQAGRQAGDAITPPSSTERTKYNRKAKEYKSLEEIDEDLTDEEELQLRNARTPIGGLGSKRKHNLEDSSPANKQSSSKRARLEQKLRSRPLMPLPAEWDMSEQEKSDLLNKKYGNLDDVRGIRPSQHPQIMQKMFGYFPEGRAQLQPNLHSRMPSPESRPAKIPARSGLLERNGVPSKSGEQFMEAVRQKVRKNLAERYAWPYETPAVTPTPADPAVQEPAEGNLRNLIDKELQALHYNLPLDEDQKAELISAMKGVARKFGNDMFSKMASGFQAMAKPGLDMALGYLTEREKLAVVALVQTQAAKKLKEFEEEIGSLTVDSPEVSQ